jgi:hypothetical protein
MIPKGASMQIRSLMFLVLACLLATPAVAQDKAIAWQGKARTVKRSTSSRRLCAGRPCCCLGDMVSVLQGVDALLQHVYDAAGKDKLDVYAIDFKDEDGDPVADCASASRRSPRARRRSDRGPVWRQGTPGFFWWT